MHATERKKVSRNETGQTDPDEETASFIPPHIIDHASQRLFVVSLFVLIQCWKIYDIILVRTTTLTTLTVALTNLNNFTFVIKYAIIDGLFLWVLPILNIPIITFSPLSTLLITLGMNAFTVVLASNATIPLFANMIIPFWRYVFNKKELTIIGDSVSSAAAVDINSHFKGRYTIHYLPDSSALFNPFHFDKLCLDPDDVSPVMMPIEFNTTTDLGSLQIEQITPDQEVRFVNYTRSDLKKLLRKDYSHLSRYDDFVSKDTRVFYAEVPISAPGKYRIASVKDAQGTNIRTYKSEFLIGHCPNARFIYPFSPGRNYKCVGAPDTEDHDFNFPLVKSFGVGPLNIEFKAKSSDGRTFAFNRTIEPENARTTNVGLLKSDSISRNILEQEVLRNPSILAARAPSKVSFQLIRITDYLGNHKLYNPLSKDHDVWFEIDLKPILPVSIIDPDSSSPLLINSSKSLRFGYDSEDSDFPLSLELAYTNNDNPLLSYSFKRVFKDAQDLKKGIEVNQEGSYRITHASNSICPCKVDATPVDVKLALPPSVDIRAEPLKDKCVGMIGYKFDFDFTGAPPFNVQYQVFKNMSRGVLKPVLNEHGLTTRVIKSVGNHHNFEYRPREEGAYIITFKNVKDTYYNKQPVPLDEKKHTYSTYFNQRSSASFFEDDRSSKTISACFNNSVSVPVHFSGNSPFSFTYEVINSRTKEKLIANEKVTNWFNDSFLIQTPQLTKGGSYSVLLKDVKDSLGCDAEFDVKESVTIKARSDVPSVSFDEKSHHFTIIEGDTVKIPLNLKSNIGKSVSDKIEYSFTPLHDSSNVKHRSISGVGHFVVKEAGTYQLEGFMNAGCKGEVLNPTRRVVIDYYPKPNITIAETSANKLLQHSEKNSLSMHLKPVCQYSVNTAYLQLQGVPPFVIDYDVQLPNGKVDSRSTTINANNVEIGLSSDQSGPYEHRFKGVYDKLYTRAKLSKLRSANKEFPIIRHDVIPLPNVAFQKASNFVQICETALKNTESSVPPVPIELTGDYPFSIKGSIRHGIGGKVENFTIADVNDPYLHFENALNDEGRLLNLDQHLQVGEHLVTLHEVQDGNGCVKKGLHEKYVIAITEAPKISKSSSKPYYCVGDHISYNMSGVSPFTVFYNFDGKHQKAETSHKFYRLASRPGVLSISALQDSSANHCLVNISEGTSLHESLKLRIHDLPSVEVSQGENVIRNVHEGDQSEITFTFTGTPPFYLKYIRTMEADKPKPNEKQRTKRRKQARKVVETTVVETIWEREHTVVTSLEGTYEAVEVRDAFCTAKRDVIPVEEK